LDFTLDPIQNLSTVDLNKVLEIGYTNFSMILIWYRNFSTEALKSFLAKIGNTEKFTPNFLFLKLPERFCWFKLPPSAAISHLSEVCRFHMFFRIPKTYPDEFGTANISI
jgi:hypothetical protein